MTSRSRPHLRAAGISAIAAIAVFVTGCGGDDDPSALTTAPPATTPTTTATTPESTEPEATTTNPEPATTPATSPTTAPTTSAAPTTPAPGPTDTQPRNPLPDITDPELLAIAEAAWAYNDAFDRARTDPTNPELEAAALATTTGKATDDVVSSLSRMREMNLAARPNPDVPSSLEITEESLAITVEGDVGLLTGCKVSGDSTVTPGAGPGGTDEPVSSEYASLVVLYTLRRLDERWLVENVERTQTYINQVGCG